MRPFSRFKTSSQTKILVILVIFFIYYYFKIKQCATTNVSNSNNLITPDLNLKKATNAVYTENVIIILHIFFYFYVEKLLKQEEI